MPPGTASQAAQDLGIAQQLPATLGGSMAPPGAQPPPPQQSPGQTANAIASQNQPPSPPTNLDDRMYEIDTGEAEAPEGQGTLRNIRDEEARVIGEQDDRADELRRIRGDEGRNREEERQRVERNERNARDEMRRLREEAEQAEEPQVLPEQRRVLPEQTQPEIPQMAAPNEKPQPGLDVLQAGGDGTEQGVEIPFDSSILIAPENQPWIWGCWS